MLKILAFYDKIHIVFIRELENYLKINAIHLQKYEKVYNSKVGIGRIWKN